jgi:TatD DNase family protein
VKFTDSHCHLDFDVFDSNRQSLITQCQSMGIHRIVVPAASPNNWKKILELHKNTVQSQFSIHPCLGIHPWFVESLDAYHLDDLSVLVKLHSNQLAAIGETGIDGVIAQKYNNLSKQITFFEFQLHLANTYNLPVIVHHQRSHNNIIQIIKQIKLVKSGIIHAFSGSYQQAKTYLDLGFKLGIGGTITYPRATKTINTIKRLPIDSFVLETDAPSMPLFNEQGEVNTPTNIIKIFSRLCELRTEPSESIGRAIEQNIEKIYNLSQS